MPKIIGWTPRRNSPLTAGGRCLRPSGEHPPLNGRDACEACGATPIYELPTRPKTVPCTRCGKNPAPAPTSIEVDPLCADCLRRQQGMTPRA